MISVIIPTLNESERIESIVTFVRRDPRVTEVIVVDDGSIDGTPELALAAGARVITSTLLGKGASMSDGMWAAQNEVLLYLDGDLQGLCEDLIERMVRPILDHQADFVKAKFSRSAGRVTTLTAKPLLRTFFPDLARFEQPLGGIIAARRSLLCNMSFENDYGVDIGLFIDVAATGAHLDEVDIGHVEHDSHPLEVLGDMATQVVRTILDRAARYQRLKLSQIREMEEIERHTQAELAVVLQKVGKAQRLALFDMDGTLLKGRYIVALAQRVNKTADLAEYLDNFQIPPEERTRRIARLFTGVTRETMEETARQMPLMPGAAETVIGLRKAGYRVGIVTDSFILAAEIVRRRVFADFSIAHLLRFRRGRATGEITLSPAMMHSAGCQHHQMCKMNVMLHLLDDQQMLPRDVLAVGDGDNDICMLRAAGTSIAFQPKTDSVRAAAQMIMQGSLTEILAALEISNCVSVSA